MPTTINAQLTGDIGNLLYSMDYGVNILVESGPVSKNGSIAISWTDNLLLNNFFSNITSITVNGANSLNDIGLDLNNKNYYVTYYNDFTADDKYTTIISDSSGNILTYNFIYTDVITDVKYVVNGSTFTYDTACFKKNTLILTPTGYTQVENLRNGDYVLSSKNIPIKIKQMSSFISSGSEKDLYVLEKSIIKENVPFMDLYMSRYHAYKLNDKWCHMGCSKSLAKIVDSNDDDIIEFYHILIDDYLSHNLVANGLEVESYGYEFRNKIKWECNENECEMKILPELNHNDYINPIVNTDVILA